MKTNTLLVGGGVITRHYFKGLENSNTLKLVALSDIDPDCIARDLFDVPFFTDINDALALKPTAAILALPVKAKVKVATELMEKGVAVIVEKPICEDYKSVRNLYDVSARTNVPLLCIFHWKYADEVIFLKNHLSEYGRIKSIATTILDDYACGGHIRQDRLSLSGAWYDSGINVLSFLDEIIDLTNIKLKEKTCVTDELSGQDKYAFRSFEADGAQIDITVDWRTDSRQKSSVIVTEKGVLDVDHTNQKIYFNKEPIFSSPTDDRLSSHYKNMFENLDINDDTKKKTMLLHKILFEE